MLTTLGWVNGFNCLRQLVIDQFLMSYHTLDYYIKGGELVNIEWV